MAVAIPVTTFECPRCTMILEPGSVARTRCPHCGWRGEAHLFRPLVPRVEKAADALPDDAVCTHHPTKRAVAICEGTGDYICALCAIELDGKTYSPQYFSKLGKKKPATSFDRYLNRPDHMVRMLLLLTLLTCGWGGLVFVPWAVYCFFKIIRQRNEDPMYRRLVGGVGLAVTGVMTLLFAVGLIALIVGVLVSIILS